MTDTLTGVNLGGKNMEDVCTQVHFYVRFQSDGAAGWRPARLSARPVWEAARCSTTSRATSTAERRARLNWTRYQTTGQALLHRLCQVAGGGGGGEFCIWRPGRQCLSVWFLWSEWFSPDGQVATDHGQMETEWSQWLERCYQTKHKLLDFKDKN